MYRTRERERDTRYESATNHRTIFVWFLFVPAPLLPQHEPKSPQRKACAWNIIRSWRFSNFFLGFNDFHWIWKLNKPTLANIYGGNVLLPCSATRACGQIICFLWILSSSVPEGCGQNYLFSMILSSEIVFSDPSQEKTIERWERENPSSAHPQAWLWPHGIPWFQKTRKSTFRYSPIVHFLAKCCDLFVWLILNFNWHRSFPRSGPTRTFLTRTTPWPGPTSLDLTQVPRVLRALRVCWGVGGPLSHIAT